MYSYPDMKNISLEFSDTLDGITVNDTAYVSKYNWYVVASNDQLYIYDERNGSWLNFAPSNALFYSALETTDGTFYIGGSILLKYDTTSSIDYNQASELDEEAIICTIKSRHFITSGPKQGFRLRKLFSNFEMSAGTVTQKLINPQDSTYRSKVTVASAGWQDFDGVTDSFTGTLTTPHKLRYEITGDIEKFNSARIDGRLRRRNRIWS